MKFLGFFIRVKEHTNKHQLKSYFIINKNLPNKFFFLSLNEKKNLNVHLWMTKDLTFIKDLTNLQEPKEIDFIAYF